MKKVLFKQLPKLNIEKLIFSSLEQALYQAIVVIDEQEYVVWESDQKTMLSRNLMQLREQFKTLDVAETVLRHESPYDEMIGQPTKDSSNRMEVKLDKNPYAAAKWLH
ncbi:hypothetical protein FLL45_15625 [Aliikangiella marina]|uniref:Uncharacterized protein n=1 Tax=Aliikangiella marina TaxID=1712262 RepID=A0A545T6P4_9GAMM|nr:DUF6482 family protein [Aliikangiella marina]TQV72894.1 hypothetical protein FLL45_15625 [Aliikangiella marina]